MRGGAGALRWYCAGDGKEETRVLGAGLGKNNPGGYLLSHTVSSAVPSALEDFTSVFEMGTGVAPPLSPPGNLVSRRLLECLLPATTASTTQGKLEKCRVELPVAACLSLICSASHAIHRLLGARPTRATPAVGGKRKVDR